MDGWIVFLLVVIVAVLILGRKQALRTVGFVFAGVVALLIIILIFYIPSFESEIQEAPQKHEILSNWRSLEAGMGEATVRRILGEPLEIERQKYWTDWNYTVWKSSATVRFEPRSLLELDKPRRLTEWKEPPNLATEPPNLATEPAKPPSPKPSVKPPSLAKAYEQPEMWQKLKEGMTKREVSEILGEPLRIASPGEIETWYYSIDSAGWGKVVFEKKLLRFRVESWREPKK